MGEEKGMTATSLPAVSIEEMRDRLLTMDDLRDRLSATEPLTELTFPVGGDARFEVDPAWATVQADYDPTGSFVNTPGGERFELSRLALLEAGAAVGIPRKKQETWPTTDIQSLLNWWFRGGAGDKEFKVLSQAREEGEPLALAMCRGTIQPFSNLTLLDVALRRIRAKFGDVEVLGDYKFHHDLELTDMRLIVPSSARVIEGTRVEDDTWCTGIDIRNSQIGLKPTTLQGYQFRWWCTNGSTTELAETPQFSRKGTYDTEDVWAWAQASVDEILGGLEGSMDQIQELARIPVDGEVTTVLRDLFALYGIPVRERQRIIAGMADVSGDVTMYDLMNEITVAANAGGLSPRTIAQLLRLGGHVAEAGSDRCNEEHPCRRLLPAGYEAPSAPALTGIEQNAAEN
jgi:hypothetical protein